jgi:dTMP kinase
MRAPFIVFEGADGAGTTTQAQLLVDRLCERGIAVKQTAEPTQGPIGKLLRAYLRDGARPLSWRGLAHLFAADRCWHVEREIRPRLEQGYVVVCDRFHLSTVVYQGLAEGGGYDRMRALAAEVRFGVAEGRYVPEMPWWVEPDVTFILDGPAEVFWHRILDRGGVQDRFEQEDFHRGVVAAYHRFGWDVGLDAGVVKVIDGAQAAEDVEAAVWAALEQVLVPGMFARAEQEEQA